MHVKTYFCSRIGDKFHFRPSTITLVYAYMYQRMGISHTLIIFTVNLAFFFNKGFVLGNGNSKII